MLKAIVLILFTLGATVTHAARPEKPIRFTVPSAAGGSPDVLMRVMTDEMAKNMGVASVVDNKPGASFTIGTAQIARAALVRRETPKWAAVIRRANVKAD